MEFHFKKDNSLSLLVGFNSNNIENATVQEDLIETLVQMMTLRFQDQLSAN
jgi:hypothetical protein